MRTCMRLCVGVCLTSVHLFSLIYLPLSHSHAYIHMHIFICAHKCVKGSNQGCYSYRRNGGGVGVCDGNMCVCARVPIPVSYEPPAHPIRLDNT